MQRVTISEEKANHINRNVATIIFIKYLIFYEYDSSDIPAYVVRFFWTDCHTQHGVHV